MTISAKYGTNTKKVKHADSYCRSVFGAVTWATVASLSGTTSVHAEVYDPASKKSASISTKEYAQLLEKKVETQKQNKDEMQLERCFELQKKLGFNTAQWASVLGVERKTLYNWKKQPQTQVQERTVDRIKLWAEFADYIEAEHRPYLAKYAFGRNGDKNMASLLLDDTKSLTELNEAYDNAYTRIDGFMNRKKREKRS